jgi:Exportin 1-like protein
MLRYYIRCNMLQPPAKSILCCILLLLTYSLSLSQVILKLLSEEVFDFARGELTQAKTKELKTSLNADFRLIHELSLWVLNAGARPDLTR